MDEMQLELTCSETVEHYWRLLEITARLLEITGGLPEITGDKLDH